MLKSVKVWQTLSLLVFIMSINWHVQIYGQTLYLLSRIIFPKILRKIIFDDFFNFLIKPPFCWKKDAPATQCKKQCESPGKQPAKYDYIQKVCQSEVDTVAIKTIRFLELKKLKPFYDDSYPMKFRVVMLVRDPRSMYHSRKKIFLNLENGNGKQMGGFMKVLKNECQAMAENFLSLEASNDISRKTYTLRYEVSYELNFEQWI